MTEAAPDHTDSKHSLDELFQLLIHARGVLPDTKAKVEILNALQRGDLQVDLHIRGGARKMRPIRESTLEESRKFEALSEALQRASGQEMREPSPEELRVLEEALQGREASEENIREAMDRATAVLYEHAPPQGLTERVHRESWEPGRVFSLMIEDGRLNVLPICALDYPPDAYSFTIANWWMVDELWPPRLLQQEPFRPGSADAWIDKLHPNDWQLFTARKIHQEAVRGGCTLTLRTFQRALANRRRRR